MREAKKLIPGLVDTGEASMGYRLPGGAGAAAVRCLIVVEFMPADGLPYPKKPRRLLRKLQIPESDEVSCIHGISRKKACHMDARR